jgi:hypothetical protein
MSRPEYNQYIESPAWHRRRHNILVARQLLVGEHFDAMGNKLKKLSKKI